MRLIIMLFWGFVLYMIFKAVVNFFRYIAASNAPKNQNNNFNNTNRNGNGSANGQENHKYNIDQKDIIDAEFEEIKPEDRKKTDNK